MQDFIRIPWDLSGSTLAELRAYFDQAQTCRDNLVTNPELLEAVCSGVELPSDLAEMLANLTTEIRRRESDRFTTVARVDLKAGTVTHLIPLAEQQRLFTAAVESSPQAQEALIAWNRELAALDLRRTEKALAKSRPSDEEPALWQPSGNPG